MPTNKATTPRKISTVTGNAAALLKAAVSKRAISKRAISAAAPVLSAAPVPPTVPAPSKRKIAGTAKAPVVVAPVVAADIAEPSNADKLLARFTASDTKYLKAASYPAGNVSGADVPYIILFAKHAAKSGLCNIAAIDATLERPSGVSILNNRARLRRLIVLGLAAYCDEHGKPSNAPSIYFKLSDKAATHIPASMR